MSIANQIAALNADKTDIAAAITAKGGTLSQNAGFDTFAAEIANLPHAYGTVRFSSQSSQMTVSGLPFTPKGVIAYYSQARGNTVSGNYTWGFIGYNADTEYKFSAMLWQPNNGTGFVWTRTAASNYISVTADGFQIEYSGYLFPRDSEYVWYAHG